MPVFWLWEREAWGWYDLIRWQMRMQAVFPNLLIPRFQYQFQSMHQGTSGFDHVGPMSQSDWWVSTNQRGSAKVESHHCHLWMLHLIRVLICCWFSVCLKLCQNWFKDRIGVCCVVGDSGLWIIFEHLRPPLFLRSAYEMLFGAKKWQSFEAKFCFRIQGLGHWKLRPLHYPTRWLPRDASQMVEKKMLRENGCLELFWRKSVLPGFFCWLLVTWV